ncbi:hypothetical protein NP493_92g01004 [Ridgeia piscesae]|uniref:Signal recognition particle 19 kDa protein n=1 Tax=Ridgeia piscesae TaxID=27915 RepID=A0AAD9UHR7_RIDPI|nr:hypothetical protein NP493_92g01004 [Ridgeia piscesae]
MMAASPSLARPWNPDYKHSERERWICVYPAYINSKKTIAQGRVIPKSKAVDNPTYAEIKDVCSATGLNLGVENKAHPRELDPRDMRFRGRIRVHLKNDDGSPVKEQFPTRKQFTCAIINMPHHRRSLLLYLGEMIPKLKSRQQSQSCAQASSQQQSVSNKKKKGKKR